MKRMFFTIAAFLSLVSGAYAWTLKTGTYDLSGGNGSFGSGYQGEVIIAPHGENYSVVWRVGARQTQVGIGIVQDDVFSVAFSDLSNSTFWGVACYRIGPWGELEGKWSSYDGTIQKPEHLTWKSYSIY